jgi:hypothetical protein
MRTPGAHLFSGEALLLLHCSLVGGPDESRISALERLSEQLGDELASLLVKALAGAGRPRPAALLS